MHAVVFHVAAAWTGVLFAATVAAVLRHGARLDQILCADTMVLLVVALLLVLTAGRGEEEFIDAALVLGLLGFTTTVALVRLVGRGDEG